MIKLDVMSRPEASSIVAPYIKTPLYSFKSTIFFAVGFSPGRAPCTAKVKAIADIHDRNSFFIISK